MYEIRLTPDALRSYQRADVPLARRLNRCFDVLSRDPHHHPNIKRLTGTLSGRWRYRVGDWRVIYRIEESPRQVFVLLIAHRRSAYGP
jgi:mRNA interferase RelE/StbE